jgi:ADP-ribose pyrophosphatase YjhB (NUDIX family)
MNKRKSVGIAFIWEDNILLTSHPKDENFKGTLSIPKGRQEKGEVDMLTAIREIKEEINISVPIQWLVDAPTHSVYAKSGREIIYYIVHIEDLSHLGMNDGKTVINPKNYQREEIIWSGFMPFDMAWKNINPSQRDILIQAGYKPLDESSSAERTIKVRWGQRESTDEWRMKENGAWEAENESPKLTYAILTKELKKGTWNSYSKPYMEITLEEAKELLGSAKSVLEMGQYGDGYFDGGSDDPLNHFEKTLKGYVNRLEKAISSNAKEEKGRSIKRLNGGGDVDFSYEISQYGEAGDKLKKTQKLELLTKLIELLVPLGYSISSAGILGKPLSHFDYDKVRESIAVYELELHKADGYEPDGFFYKGELDNPSYKKGGGVQAEEIINFSHNQREYLSDQVDIIRDSYDSYYDDNGVLDKESADDLEYPYTLQKNKNDLEILKSKIENKEGSYFSKIERDILLDRIGRTYDTLEDANFARYKVSLTNAMKKLEYAKGGSTALAEGTKIEMEHKDTIEKIKSKKLSTKDSAKLIAKDHLDERDDYYEVIKREKLKDGGGIGSVNYLKGKKTKITNILLEGETEEQGIDLMLYKDNDLSEIAKANWYTGDYIDLNRLNNQIHELVTMHNLGQVFLMHPDENGDAYEQTEIWSKDGKQNDIKEDGGVIEGQLHSECNDDDGCGVKFTVGGGKVIEAERDEAVIVSGAFNGNILCPNDNCEYEIEGTPSQIASAINVLGGGMNFDKGATIKDEAGKTVDMPQMKSEAKDTDVDRHIESGSIIINRRSMAMKEKMKVKGTLRQIASAINSVKGNGVVIEQGASVK